MIKFLAPKKFVKEAGSQPKKSLGQNFLVNYGVIDKIIKSAELSKETAILEIGAGSGVLTNQLAQESDFVFTVEIDDKLTQKLAETIGVKYKNVYICKADVLSENFDNLFEKWLVKNKIKSYKIVANIPYNITSLILRKFLEYKFLPETMFLMVQKEVAQRICASTGEMSLLAVSVQYYAEAKKLFTVSRGSFYPAPAVDSAVIRLDLKKKTNNNFSDDFFFKVVKAGFKAKRKKLLGNLRSLGIDKDKLESIFKQLNFDQGLRAQHLSIQDWQKLVILFANIK